MKRRLRAGADTLEVTPGAPSFSLSYIKPNLENTYRFFTADRADYGTISVLFWLAAVGLGLMVWSLVRRRRQVGLRVWGLVSVSTFVVSVYLGLLLVFFWGNLTYQPALRLGIVFMPFLVVLAVLPLRALAPHVASYERWAAVGALGLLLWYWPIAGRNVAFREIVVYREFIEVTGFLRREYPEKNVLLVSDLSHLYTPFRYGALKFERVNREPQRIAQWYRQRQGRDVVAIQRIQLATGRPTPATTLAPGYVTEVIDEAPLGDDVVLRFSRVRPRTEPDRGLR